jgi:hypothetical protein
MARAYITFDVPSVADGQLYVGAALQAPAVEGFNGISIAIGFEGEPSAETITATLIAVLVATGNVSYPGSFDAGDVVTFGAPV